MQTSNPTLSCVFLCLRITPEGGACVQASKPTKAWLLLFAGDKRGGAKTAGLSGVKGGWAALASRHGRCSYRG